jgi:hypothetical protein
MIARRANPLGRSSTPAENLVSHAGHGIHAAPARGMSRNTSGPPRSYEEVVRKTVVDPDSSARPTLEQEQAAREGLRALDSDERALQDRVVRAVSSTGANAAGVTVEVSRELVTLRGRVADPAMLRAVEDAVARVPGVATIHSLIVVGSLGALARHNADS